MTHGQVILDTTFPDNSTNLPATTAWRSSSGIALSVGSGSMTLTPSNNNLNVLGYVTANTSTNISLAEGETLKLTLTFSLQGIATGANALKIGLFSTQGTTRVTGNNFSDNFTNYTGYAFMTAVNSAGASTTVMARDPANANATLISNIAAFDELTGASSQSANTLINGQSYTMSLSITNLGLSGSQISYSWAGLPTHTFTDSTFNYTDFNTIGINLRNSSATSITITQMELAVVPEPTTAAMSLFGAIAVFGVLGKRRRRH